MALGQGLMVYEAAQMARAGAAVDQIIDCLETVQDRMLFYLAASSTAYLARSGQDGHDSGDLADGRPVLTMYDGIIEAVELHEMRTQAILAMRKLALQTERMPGMRLGVMHGNCEAEALLLSRDIGGKLGPETLLIAEIGATVGVNTGPGTLGFCWYALENA
jgi:fatty acid-binding protein DegV